MPVYFLITSMLLAVLGVAWIGNAYPREKARGGWYLLAAAAACAAVAALLQNLLSV